MIWANNTYFDSILKCFTKLLPWTFQMMLIENIFHFLEASTVSGPWKKLLNCNFINKETLALVYSCEFAKFLRTTFLKNNSIRLLLILIDFPKILSVQRFFEYIQTDITCRNLNTLFRLKQYSQPYVILNFIIEIYYIHDCTKKKFLKLKLLNISTIQH